MQISRSTYIQTHVHHITVTLDADQPQHLHIDTHVHHVTVTLDADQPQHLHTDTCPSQLQ